MPDSFWCENCGHRDDVRHWDPSTARGEHLAGVEYGWVGRLLAIEAAAYRLGIELAHLLGDTERGEADDGSVTLVHRRGLHGPAELFDRLGDPLGELVLLFPDGAPDAAKRATPDA